MGFSDLLTAGIDGLEIRFYIARKHYRQGKGLRWQDLRLQLSYIR
jgi:predicted carbohydrate-binding protein with CBM5 and CBM33 domain